MIMADARCAKVHSRASCKMILLATRVYSSTVEQYDRDGVFICSRDVQSCIWLDNIQRSAENCTPLDRYVASGDNSLPMFWDNPSVPSSRMSNPRIPFFLNTLPLKMGPIGCPETSVRNYHYCLCNSPEERTSRLQRSGSLKSRISVVCRTLAKIVRLNFHIVVIKVATGQL
jgi:hypothetical protein